MAPSILPASYPWARCSTSRRRTVATRCRLRPEPGRALALLLLLAACEPESDRPVLASYRPGAAVEPALLVGTWRCSDLNPYPDQPLQAITTIYAADGTYESASVVPKRGPVGAIRVIQRGRWSIDAGRLLTADVVTDAHAVDGNTSTEALAKASAQTVDAMSAGKPAASEVLRLDARRLTLRPVEVTDPPVIGCLR
ncbi:MAG: hypothetical protein ACJ8H8_27500 [Geminicoccaceae bacterium]